jgi:nitrite reductase/ring-hydroxylating ferredoxin subunit
VGATVLCHLDDLADGTSRGFDPDACGQDSVIVVRRHGLAHVYRNACPHLDTPLAWRKDAYLNGARDHIACFAHGALFDIATGVCVLGPCLGQHLPALAFHVDAGGYIVLD